jgi:hypothetical protein
MVHYSKVEIYDFNPETGTFSLDSISTELFNVDEKDFFMESTPDSLARYPYLFRIQETSKGIAICRLDNPVPWFLPQGEESKKFLKGNVICFDFVDGIFVRSEPYFDSDPFLAKDEDE